MIDKGSEAAEAGGEDPEGGDSAAEEGSPGLRGLQGDCLANSKPFQQIKPNYVRLPIEQMSKSRS